MLPPKFASRCGFEHSQFVQESVGLAVGTHEFYADIPLLKERTDITHFDLYRELPEDWSVVVTDIQGSTTAVAQGKYKEINLIGAACITSCLNACGRLKIPYVFGGDGATLLIPGDFIDPVAAALGGLISLADQKFGFNLRVGIIPYRQIKHDGHSILVAKLGMSDTVDQCVLRGTGVTEAERLTKQANSTFLISRPKGAGTPLLDGLECRWEPVASHAGRFLSLLVSPISDDSTQKKETVRRVLNFISDLQQQRQAIHASSLRLTLNPLRLLSEAKLKSSTGLQILIHVLKSYVLNLVGWTSNRFGLTIGGFSGQKYQREVTENTDAFKYDEVIRMVIDLSPQQEQRLEEFLQSMHRQGLLAYGLHFSSTALLTCMVFDRDSHHVHLIDGNDGGYTAASKQLKAQLKAAK